MEPGFPKRGIITDRGLSLDLGGNYRYKYDLCPWARTVVVTDLNDDVGTFAPASIASSARVATINLTAGETYHSIVFRSTTRQVYVFGTAKVYVIDANPDSGTFNTILDTISTTSFNVSNTSVQYSPLTDRFYFNAISWNPISKSSSSAPEHLTYVATNVMSIPGMLNTSSGNGNMGSAIDELSNDYTFTFRGFAIKPILIGNRLYMSGDGLAPFRRMLLTKNVFSPRQEASVNLAVAISRGDSAYDPVSKNIVITSYNGVQVQLVQVAPTFQFLSNITAQFTGYYPTNQNSFGQALFSPYSGKFYLRPGRNGSVGDVGLDRYHIVDPRVAVANMFIGYRNIDAGSHVGSVAYTNVISCFNGLKIDYYDS